MQWTVDRSESQSLNVAFCCFHFSPLVLLAPSGYSPRYAPFGSPMSRFRLAPLEWEDEFAFPGNAFAVQALHVACGRPKTTSTSAAFNIQNWLHQRTVMLCIVSCKITTTLNSSWWLTLLMCIRWPHSYLLSLSFDLLDKHKSSTF